MKTIKQSNANAKIKNIISEMKNWVPQQTEQGWGKNELEIRPIKSTQTETLRKEIVKENKQTPKWSSKSCNLIHMWFNIHVIG